MGRFAAGPPLLQGYRDRRHRTGCGLSGGNSESHRIMQARAHRPATGQDARRRGRRRGGPFRCGSVRAGGTGPDALALTEYSTPAITVAGGDPVIAIQTSHDGLQFYRKQSGTDTWRGEPVAGNQSTYSAPSIAQDGSSVIIAAQGPDNSLDFYWQQAGATGWSGETIARAGTARTRCSQAQASAARARRRAQSVPKQASGTSQRHRRRRGTRCAGCGAQERQGPH
jgi:hypothetical protein